MDFFIDFEECKKEFTPITKQEFDEQFTFVEVLGQGGFGIVTLIKDQSNQYYALKTFLTQCIKNNLNTVVKEIRNLKKLIHPNIIRWHGSYLIDDVEYVLLCQYCQNKNLQYYLKHNNVNQEEKIRICLQIAEGLSYMHSLNIIHRDLKPENILIDYNKTIKIGDLGCSTEKRENEVLHSVVGSYRFMDTRVMEGNYEKQVDIYSLGLVYMMIFKGRTIYDTCMTYMEIISKKNEIYKDFNRNIETYIFDIDEPMKRIIKSCLNRNKNERYEAAQIAKILRDETRKIEKSRLSSTTIIDEDLFLDSENDGNVFHGLLGAKIKEIKKHQMEEEIVAKCKNILNNSRKIHSYLELTSELDVIKLETKKQFIFYILYYHLNVLGEFKQQFESNQSKYNQINVELLSEDNREIITKQINEEMQEYLVTYFQFAKDIAKDITILSKNTYLPPNYLAIVQKAAYESTVHSHNFDTSKVRQEIKLFHQKRIVVQYYTNMKSNTEVDPKLDDIGKIANYLN